VQVGFAQQQVKTVYPIASEVVQQDTRRAFINNGINLPFGCFFEIVIIKGKESGIIFFVKGFCVCNDAFQLCVGIEIIIVLTNCIIVQPSGNIEFPVPGFFGRQWPVFKFAGLFQLNTGIGLGLGSEPGCGQQEQAKGMKNAFSVHKID
jgi:hypothetical protein